MTINVTLKAVKEEITQDEELANSPAVMKRDAILNFLEEIEYHSGYTLTTRSKDAIVKYANGLVKGDTQK